MGLYEDLKTLGWTDDQLAQFYPELKPGNTTWTPEVSAAERSYQDSMATFERVAAMQYNQGRIGPVTEYQKQLTLELHPEMFGDVSRAQAEIGIPSDRSFAESHPEFATGTRYQEYGTTAPGLLPSHAPYSQTPGEVAAWNRGERIPGGGEWGDMLALGVVGLLGLVTGSFLLGK